jgi:hypothetical protein
LLKIEAAIQEAIRLKKAAWARLKKILYQLIIITSIKALRFFTKKILKLSIKIKAICFVWNKVLRFILEWVKYNIKKKVENIENVIIKKKVFIFEKNIYFNYYKKIEWLTKLKHLKIIGIKTFYYTKLLTDINVKSLIQAKKFDFNLTESVRYTTLRWYNYSKILNKKTLIEYFFKDRIIWGYKFRFAGRFSRKRKRSIVWIKRGMLPIGSHEKLVDYGAFVFKNKYSAISVRVWINRNKEFVHKHFLRL